MKKDTYKAIIDHLAGRRPSQLRNFLKEKRNQGGLKACGSWLKSTIKSIKKGQINFNNQEASSLDQIDDELNDLAEELDQVIKENYNPPYEQLPKGKDLGWGEPISTQTKQAISEIDAIKQLANCHTEIEVFLGTEKKSEKKEGNAGRKPTDEADIEQIRPVVKKLVEAEKAVSEKTKLQKQFINKEGNPKPTTIRDFILENYPSLYGEASGRTVYRRVIQALKDLGYK